jgi:hypothetical protein
VARRRKHPAPRPLPAPFPDELRRENATMAQFVGPWEPLGSEYDSWDRARFNLGVGNSGRLAFCGKKRFWRGAVRTG